MSKEPYREFVESYSDDLIYLREARKTLLRYPWTARAVQYMDASLGRKAFVVYIGAVELMIEKVWDGEGRLKPLKDFIKKTEKLCYATTDAKKRDLEDELKTLKSQINFVLNEEVINDYIACKSVRNAIVHSDWIYRNNKSVENDRRDFVKSRGLPVSLGELKFEHWKKVEQVYCTITHYIMRAYVPQYQSQEAVLLTPLDILRIVNLAKGGLSTKSVVKHQQDNSLSNFLPDLDENQPQLVTVNDIHNVYAVNLRRLYDYLEGRIARCIERSGQLDTSYLAVFRASLYGEIDIDVSDEDISISLESWTEHFQRFIKPLNISKEDATEAVAIFQFLYERNIRPEKGTFDDISRCNNINLLREHVRRELFHANGVEIKSDTSLHSVTQALVLGERLDKVLYFCPAAELFLLHLPIARPYEAERFLNYGLQALWPTQIAHLWHGLPRKSFEMRPPHVKTLDEISILSIGDIAKSYVEVLAQYNKGLQA